MNLIIVLIHVVASIALIAIVLLQTGKGAEMGAAFGGASQTLFGGSGGSSFMSKLTTGAAVVFMITCLVLSYKPSNASRSIMHDMPAEQHQSQPAPVLPEARPVQPDSSAAPAKAPAASPSAQETPKAPPASAPAKK